MRETSEWSWLRATPTAVVLEFLRPNTDIVEVIFWPPATPAKARTFIGIAVSRGWLPRGGGQVDRVRVRRALPHFGIRQTSRRSTMKAITFGAALEIARMRWSEGRIEQRRRKKPMSPKTQHVYGMAVRRLAHEAGIVESPKANRSVDICRLLGPDAVARELQQWVKREFKRIDAAEISSSKVHVDRAALVAFFEALVPEVYPDNPAYAVPEVAVERGLPRPMENEEVALLFQQPDTTTPEGLRDRCMLELYYNALRANETLGLTTDMVTPDFDRQRVVLRFSGKGDTENDTVLTKHTSTLLCMHLLRQYAAEHAEAWMAKAPDKRTAHLHALKQLVTRLREPKPVFLQSGKQIQQRQLNRVFVKYRDLAGLDPSYGPHSLRHSCLTNLFNAGADIRSVQAHARHADIRTTQIYTKVARQTKADTIDLLPMLGTPWKP